MRFLSWNNSLNFLVIIIFFITFILIIFVFFRILCANFISIFILFAAPKFIFQFTVVLLLTWFSAQHDGEINVDHNYDKYIYVQVHIKVSIVPSLVNFNYIFCFTKAQISNWKRIICLKNCFVVKNPHRCDSSICSFPIVNITNQFRIPVGHVGYQIC